MGGRPPGWLPTSVSPNHVTMQKFYFNRAMGTKGAVSGKPYFIREGQTVNAPDGEFDHLDPDAFKAEKAKATSKKKAGRPRKKKAGASE